MTTPESTESPESPGSPGRPAVPAPPATGVAAVDRVLGALDGVEEQPVAARAGVFEQVHADLRRALDPGEDDDLGATVETDGTSAGVADRSD